MTNNNRISARITPEMKEKLIELQNKTGSTLTETIENVIDNGLNYTGIPHSNNAITDDYSLNDLVREVGEIRKRGYNEGYVDCLNDKKDNPNALSFIGGTDTPEKKDNEEKEDDDDEDEEDEYECPCGAVFDTPVDFCTECGEELTWDDDEEEGWLSSLINWNNGG